MEAGQYPLKTGNICYMSVRFPVISSKSGKKNWTHTKPRTDIAGMTTPFKVFYVSYVSALSALSVVHLLTIRCSSVFFPVFALRHTGALSTVHTDIKIDTCHSLTWRSALLGQDKDWFAQCKDNVTEWDSRSWCWQPGVPLRQCYEVTMSAHCDKSVAIPPLGLSHNCEAQLHTAPDH